MRTTDLVKCFDLTGEIKTRIQKPEVFNIIYRNDIVSLVYRNVKTQTRNPYAVSPLAGKKHSAESWGPGRAVSRVSRVKGSGTRRAGQGAFANFCRKGHMAFPTSIQRIWHKSTTNQLRRHAIAHAITASGNASMVEARGHKIEKLESIPLVVSDKIESLLRTKQAVEVLEALKLSDELEKVKLSKRYNPTTGSMRNRRYKYKTGLLVVFKEDRGIMRAFRNIRGVDLMRVDDLDLLKLAPGGQAGRLILWTESAFRHLDTFYSQLSASGYKMPLALTVTLDVMDIYRSPAVQAILSTARKQRPEWMEDVDTMRVPNHYGRDVRTVELISMYDKGHEAEPRLVLEQTYREFAAKHMPTLSVEEEAEYVAEE